MPLGWLPIRRYVFGKVAVKNYAFGDVADKTICLRGGCRLDDNVMLFLCKFSDMNTKKLKCNFVCLFVCLQGILVSFPSANLFLFFSPPPLPPALKDMGLFVFFLGGTGFFVVVFLGWYKTVCAGGGCYRYVCSGAFCHRGSGTFCHRGSGAFCHRGFLLITVLTYSF